MADDGTGAAADDASTDTRSSGDERRSRSVLRPSREVVVPLRLYKTVTVFSTLLAVLLVVVGFVILDTATQRGGLQVTDIDPALALVGLFAIGLGGAVYAFAARFRAEGMGKDKDDGDEESHDG